MSSRPAHFIRVLLIDTKNDGLGELVSAFHEVAQVAGEGLGSGTQCDDPFKVLGLILAVRDLPPIAIHLALAGPPACRIHIRDYSMHPIGSQKTVIDARTQTVRVDGITKITIGIAVVLPLRGGRHPDLERRLKIAQDFTPVAVVARTAPVTLVNDNQIKKVPREFLVEPRPPGVL